MIVVKFGGSSLANAEQFKKVGTIVHADKRRKYVIPSAPGRRFAGDAKVTVTGEHALRLTMTLGTSQGEFLNPDYVMIALDQETHFLDGSPLENTYLIRRLTALDKDKKPFR